MSDETLIRRNSLDNRATCIPRARDPEEPDDEALDPKVSFILAYDRLALLTGVARGPAVFIAAVGHNARIVESLCLEDRRAMVVGRHTQCALRLPGDSVSLRHVAILLRCEDSKPFVHLWDLRTDKPFLTEDRQPNGALIAEGPLYIAIEGYALWILPSTLDWQCGAEAAWSALPQRCFIDRRPPEHRPAAPPQPEEDAESWTRTTRITRTMPPMLLGEGTEPEIGWGVVRVGGKGRFQKRSVSAERLELGVLIGRDPRCGILVADDAARLSRVHLLLVRIGGKVWAIDTASTHGVLRGDAAISATVLEDRDTLTLTDEMTLEWQRTSYPEA